MEPASIESKAPSRTGSLENPEVVENVPGHVIPILEREFDDFDTESTRFLKGQLEQDDFIKFRLKQGVYGQRQADVQMIRVKLPFVGVAPDQLDAFADGIEKLLWPDKRLGQKSIPVTTTASTIVIPGTTRILRIPAGTPIDYIASAREPIPAARMAEAPEPLGTIADSSATSACGAFIVFLLGPSELFGHPRRVRSCRALRRKSPRCPLQQVR